LLTDTSDDQALAAVERLREMTPELGCFSAGVASWDGTQELDELLRRADVALYTAKTHNGSSVAIAPRTLEPSEAFPAD
jgi:GGDEF domain-containing protein